MLYLRAILVYKPPRAYIRRCLYMELLIWGILWYFRSFTIFFLIVKISYNFAKKSHVVIKNFLVNKEILITLISVME